MSVVSSIEIPAFQYNLYPPVKELAQAPVNEDDEWFSTPRITLPSPSPTSINPGSTEGAVLPVAVSTRSPSPVVESGSHPNTVNADLAATESHPQQRRSSAESSIVPLDLPKQTLPLTKRQKKKLRKAQREHEGAASTTIPAPPPAAHVPSVEPIRGGPPEQTSSSSFPPLPTLSSELNMLPEQHGTTAPVGTPASPQLNAGFFTGTVSSLYFFKTKQLLLFRIDI
jgi:hypothetical protein